MKRNKGLNISNTIYQHIKNNNKEYIIVALIFIIGIFLGVMFINNTQENQMEEITTYLNNFIEKLKNIENLENVKMLRQSILENIIFGILLWFFGTTVIRDTNSIWINII